MVNIFWSSKVHYKESVQKKELDKHTEVKSYHHYIIVYYLKKIEAT